jgi:hypothetical protein
MRKADLAKREGYEGEHRQHIIAISVEKFKKWKIGLKARDTSNGI